jgi:hypothetical protein
VTFAQTDVNFIAFNDPLLSRRLGNFITTIAPIDGAQSISTKFYIEISIIYAQSSGATIIYQHSFTKNQVPSYGLLDMSVDSLQNHVFALDKTATAFHVKVCLTSSCLESPEHRYEKDFNFWVPYTLNKPFMSVFNNAPSFSSVITTNFGSYTPPNGLGLEIYSNANNADTLAYTYFHQDVMSGNTLQFSSGWKDQFYQPITIPLFDATTTYKIKFYWYLNSNPTGSPVAYVGPLIRWSLPNVVLASQDIDFVTFMNPSSSLPIRSLSRFITTISTPVLSSFYVVIFVYSSGALSNQPWKTFPFTFGTSDVSAFLAQTVLTTVDALNAYTLYLPSTSSQAFRVKVCETQTCDTSPIQEGDVNFQMPYNLVLPTSTSGITNISPQLIVVDENILGSNVALKIFNAGIDTLTYFGQNSNSYTHGWKKITGSSWVDANTANEILSAGPIYSLKLYWNYVVSSSQATYTGPLVAP